MATRDQVGGGPGSWPAKFGLGHCWRMFLKLVQAICQEVSDGTQKSTGNLN
jgi:hypothetical protein